MRTKTRQEVIIAKLRDLGLEQQKLLQELAALENSGKGYSRNYKRPDFERFLAKEARPGSTKEHK